MTDGSMPNGGATAPVAEPPAPGATDHPVDAERPVDAPAEPTPSPKVRSASIFPGEGVPLPHDLADALEAVQAAFGMPLWFILQSDPPEQAESFQASYKVLGPAVADDFFLARRELAECEKVLLVVDSPGGYAGAAYSTAMLLRRHCGSFDICGPPVGKECGDAAYSRR